MKTTPFLEHIIESFGGETNIKARAMFGGYGLYSDNIIFAIIANNELYFKGDEFNKSFYEKQGSETFKYEGKDKIISMSYYKAVPEIYEDEELLKKWFQSALEASYRKRKK
jgi:DNA transformation protein